MAWRKEIEASLWLVALASVLWFAVNRIDLSRRAVMQLKVDGYRDVVLIGHDCRVARALSADGEEVTAWACIGEHVKIERTK